METELERKIMAARAALDNAKWDATDAQRQVEYCQEALDALLDEEAAS